MPTQVVKSGGVFKGVGRYGFLSIGALFRFFLKHYILVIFLIIVFPAVIGSVKVAIETQNPIHPFLELGKRIFAADISTKQDVILLEEQGVEAMIKMPKPTEGIWAGVKYKWFFFWRVIFRLFSNVYLIFIPLIVVYRIIKASTNVSERSKPAIKALIIFIVYLLIVNMIFITYNALTGTTQITLPEGIPEHKQMWYIVLHSYPLSGMVSLFKYLITSAVV